MISYKSGRVFPPQVVFAGSLILLAGLFFVTRAMGIIMILTGAFILFSTDQVRINTDTRSIRSGTALFGIIPTGKQRRIDEFNGVTVVPATVCTTTRSLSNRSNSVQAREFRVYLIEKEQKTTLLIRKFRVAGEAFAFSRQLSSMLQIPLIPEINRYNLHKPSLDAGPKQKSP